MRWDCSYGFIKTFFFQIRFGSTDDSKKTKKKSGNTASSAKKKTDNEFMGPPLIVWLISLFPINQSNPSEIIFDFFLPANLWRCRHRRRCAIHHKRNGCVCVFLARNVHEFVGMLTDKHCRRRSRRRAHHGD